jgi:hypothetical protein
VTQAPSLVQLFIVPLNAARMDYMVTGGLAAVVYGHPRLTLDVDLVIRLETRESVGFAALWDPLVPQKMSAGKPVRMRCCGS